jgi:hypothetical protein
MGEAVKTVPDIIKAASSSLLGILALIILVLACLAYLFFKGASVKVRVWIFLTLFLGATLYAFAISKAAKPVESEHPGITFASIDGVVADANGGKSIAQATITTALNASPAVTDSNGIFHLKIKTPDAGDFVVLHVSKDGYQSLDTTVTPPLNGGIIILLAKAKSPTAALPATQPDAALPPTSEVVKHPPKPKAKQQHECNSSDAEVMAVGRTLEDERRKLYPEEPYSRTACWLESEFAKRGRDCAVEVTVTAGCSVNRGIVIEKGATIGSITGAQICANDVAIDNFGSVDTIDRPVITGGRVEKYHCTPEYRKDFVTPTSQPRQTTPSP